MLIYIPTYAETPIQTQPYSKQDSVSTFIISETKMFVMASMYPTTFISLSNLLLSFLSEFLSLISLSSSYWSNTHEISTPKNDHPKQGNDRNGSISSIEFDVVIRSLGIQCKTDADTAEETQIKVNEDDLIGVFDEEEPSLGEIKEAFNVFDVNKDGFIDAMELSRVLSGLGIIKESGVHLLEKCRNMIRNYDRTGKGVLDFHDFLKLMELSLNSSS